MSYRHDWMRDLEARYITRYKDAILANFYSALVRLKMNKLNKAFLRLYAEPLAIAFKQIILIRAPAKNHCVIFVWLNSYFAVLQSVPGRFALKSHSTSVRNDFSDKKETLCFCCKYHLKGPCREIWVSQLVLAKNEVFRNAA